LFHLRIVQMAVKGLRQNLMRSMLATLGVIIGVGAVISAVSILEGAQLDILERFESLGADQVLVFNGSDRRSGRRAETMSLLPEDAELIKQEGAGLIVATSPQYSGVGQVKYFEKNVPAQVLGTNESYAVLNKYEVVQGEFITREDVRGNGMLCVPGHKAAQELFGALPAVGKTVKINGKSFIVKGVMEEKGVLGFVEVDEQVIIPLTTAMGRMFGKRYLTMLVVQCIDARRVPDCIKQVKKTLRASHRIRAGEDEDFAVFTQDQFMRELGQVTMLFAVVLYSIAGISLIVGAIGIMNIMLVSVTERTREIGVRIAVGARRMDILKQFLTEASIISLFGGALGIACGWAISNFLEKFTEVLKTYTPPMSIVVALGTAIIVGLLSGIYPAVRASRLNPVQALRYE